jgi:phage anti-repressor protein
MTDQELKDLVASLAIQSAKTDAKLERIGKMVGGISNNQGDIAEEFFYNSIKDKPTLAGINYDFIEKNVTRKKDNIEDEYDMLLVNGKDIAIIETKYKAHEKDLERLLNKKYTNFKKLYPEYKNYTHHLNLASFYISDDLKQQALESGVSVLQRKGDVVETTIA